MLAALIALLQIICLAINGVSALSRCHMSSYLTGKSGKSNRENGSECCVACHRYPQFRCSPPVSVKTPAVLTLNSFVADGDGGGPPYCDGRYHSDRELVVALSSGWLWLDGRARCNKMVRVRLSAPTGSTPWPRWSTSATGLTGATRSTTLSCRATTTSWMRRRRCGRRSGLARTSASSRSDGLMFELGHAGDVEMH